MYILILHIRVLVVSKYELDNFYVNLFLGYFNARWIPKFMMCSYIND